MIGFALLIAVIFGASVSSGEFRHSTATVTYLAFPNRTHVLLPKLTVTFAIGLLFGALGFAASTAVAMIFISADGYHTALSASTIFGDAGGAILAGGLLSALGVALGTLIRSQLAVANGTFIWVVLGESILGGVYNQIGPYLPFTAATTLSGAKLGGGGFGFAGSSTATRLAIHRRGRPDPRDRSSNLHDRRAPHAAR